MFITNQAAAVNSASKSHRHHKDAHEGHKSKHRTGDTGKPKPPRLGKYAAGESFDSGKIIHSSRRIRKPDVTTMLSVSTIGAHNLTDRKWLSHNQLDSVISPRKALSSSPLLLKRTNSLESLHMRDKRDKHIRDDFSGNKQLPKETSKHKSKDRLSVDKENVMQEKKIEKVRKISIRPLSFQLYPPSETEKSEALLKEVLKRENHLYVNNMALLKTVSLPVLSQDGKVFLLPPDRIPRDNLENQIASSECSCDLEGSIELPVNVLSYIPSDVNSNNETNSSSLADDHPSDWQNTSIDQDQADGERYMDKILPIHSNSLFRTGKARPHRQIKKKKASKKSPENGKESPVTKKASIEGESYIDSYSHCSVYGEGLKRGIVSKPASFELSLQQSCSLEDIKVEITGPRLIPPQMKLKQLQHGLYRVTYWPETSGKYQVSIKRKGSHICQSPFEVDADFECSSVWQKVAQ